MAKVLKDIFTSGSDEIVQNYTINSWHVSQSVDALTGADAYDITISGSTFYKPGSGALRDNVTGSYFAPYITTVGLYDENQNLLAIGKLAQPLPTSATTDTTILVNIDK